MLKCVHIFFACWSFYIAVMSPYFSIRLHFGGKFNFDFTSYVGGKIAYFDMCSVVGLTLSEMEAMYGEV